MDKLIKGINVISVSAAEDILKSAGTEVLFEKAKHQDGDLHPNGKWYWKQSANGGKGDWRVIKSGTQAKPKVWEMHPDLAKCKTSQECQQYVMDKGYISFSSDISKADLKSAQLICSALVNLHDVIPYSRIELKMVKINGATMQATQGRLVEINSDYFTHFDPKRYWEDTNTKYVKRAQAAAVVMKDQIDRILKANPKADVSKLKRSYDKLKEKLDKFPRWTYGDESTLAADIVLHEMGHILNAQCTGSCTFWKHPKYQSLFTPQERKYHLTLNKERDDIFERNKKDKTMISEYSSTKNVEWFAENFVAWLHKDKEQPRYVSDYFDKYFKTTTPRR